MVGLVFLAALASGCVRTASAEPSNSVDLPLASIPAPTSLPVPAPDEINSSLVPELAGATGPHGRLAWTYIDESTTLGFTTTLEAELVFTELQRVTDGADSEEHGASTAYRVDGYLTHVPGMTSCSAPGESCRVVRLQDADLVGLAIRRDGVLSLDLQWRTFGLDEMPDRPSARIAVGLHEIGYEGVAGSLEAGDVIGSTLVLSTLGDGSRALTYARGTIVAHGRLTVDFG